MTLTERTNNVLAKLREMAECENITTGPWRNSGTDVFDPNNHRIAEVRGFGYDAMGMRQANRDTAFIARSRTITPAMAKALIVVIKAFRRYASDLCDNDGQGCPCATDSDLELVGIIKTLEESL